MSVGQRRILIFGAGVIGSFYGAKFAEAGIKVTLLARGKRLDMLRREGLRYHENGKVKRVKVEVIDQLKSDDIYDYIFVPVRYDHVEKALHALKDNQSPTIVTMTNIPTGYAPWLDIVGDRLLPAFPSAGGEIKGGVVYAQFGPSALQATTFGEVNGQESERVKGLAELFRKAEIASSISKNMTAFQITHAAWVVGMNKVIYTDKGIMSHAEAVSPETVRRMTSTIKAYVGVLEKAEVPITPAKFKLILKVPDWLMTFALGRLLRTKMVSDVLLGGHASVVRPEIEMLDKSFIDFLRNKKISIPDSL